MNPKSHDHATQPKSFIIIHQQHYHPFSKVYERDCGEYLWDTTDLQTITFKIHPLAIPVIPALITPNPIFTRI
jgi:hypothetical protein